MKHGRNFGLADAIACRAALAVCLFLFGCSIGENPSDSSVPKTPSFDTALKHQQTALVERKGPRDMALYNIGLILSHPANPKKDLPKALYTFKTLVAEHPRSKFVDQSKAWIQVLEQQQKNDLERQRLLEEKRALSREREILSQERQRLNYTSERSQQLDLEIDRRRRQSLSK